MTFKSLFEWQQSTTQTFVKNVFHDSNLNWVKPYWWNIVNEFDDSSLLKNIMEQTKADIKYTNGQKNIQKNSEIF